MFERPSHGGRAILVHIKFKSDRSTGSDDLQEFRELAASTGAELLSLVIGSSVKPQPKYFSGKGKAQEVAAAVKSQNADLVIYDHQLSPAQERNLEQLFSCRVLDRTGMILDIFAQRARSHEGKLQVELAQLRYLSTRLVRGWSHLERQKGGIGLRGPGEKQLETDRRLLGIRIRSIRKRLLKVNTQREQGRQSRKKAEVPTVALVGYTNAGKSTLFNTLCDTDIYAADQLFATLDPTLRKLDIDGVKVVLADTVGFIRQLPHDLVAAFRATLQETREADLLLHVIDSSDPRSDAYIEQVNEVLQEVGADKIPQILVYNKIDQTQMSAQVITDAFSNETSVWVSALEDVGMSALQEVILNKLEEDVVRGQIDLGSEGGAVRALLYRNGSVMAETHTDLGGWSIQIKLAKKDYQRLLKQYPEIEPLTRLETSIDLVSSER